MARPTKISRTLVRLLAVVVCIGIVSGHKGPYRHCPVQPANDSEVPILCRSLRQPQMLATRHGVHVERDSISPATATTITTTTTTQTRAFYGTPINQRPNGKDLPWMPVPWRRPTRRSISPADERAEENRRALWDWHNVFGHSWGAPEANSDHNGPSLLPGYHEFKKFVRRIDFFVHRDPRLTVLDLFLNRTNYNANVLRLPKPGAKHIPNDEQNARPKGKVDSKQENEPKDNKKDKPEGKPQVKSDHKPIDRSHNKRQVSFFELPVNTPNMPMVAGSAPIAAMPVESAGSHKVPDSALALTAAIMVAALSSEVHGQWTRCS